MSTVNARRSNWWFLLPIVMQVVGGVIAYFILRHDDPPKARNCLYLGIVLTVVQICIGLVVEPLIISIFGLSPLA